MSTVFLGFVNRGITAGWIVLAVLLLRLLFKRAPKWLTVLLWGMVAVRLICPFTIESVLSLVPSAQTLDPADLLATVPQVHTGVPILNQTINPLVANSLTADPTASVNPLQIVVSALAAVWLTGVAVLLVYGIVSCLRVKGRIRTAIPLQGAVFESENIRSPFVFGVFRPKIYLPRGLCEPDRAYVIAHEQAHIRRGDPVWKALGFLLLTLYWFQPLLWLAYALLCRDIELACDEKAVRPLTPTQRAAYSQALLNCSTGRHTVAACPLAFGEVGVKGRVSSVLCYKKPAVWIVAAAIAAGGIAAVCFLTDPASTQLKDVGNRISGSVAEDTAAVWISADGESYHAAGAVDHSLLQELGGLSVSRERFVLRRRAEEDAAYTLILQTAQESGATVRSAIAGTYICFNSDFTLVYLRAGEKSTPSYRVRVPAEAKRLCTAIAGYSGSPDDDIVQLYEATPAEQLEEAYDREEPVISIRHARTRDGQWLCNGRTYRYRLEITGRLSHAAKQTTYIVLSNTPDIPFDRVWPASGFGSHTDEYFLPDEAVIVGLRTFS